jgi:cyclopropane fatty-acyl-phospholipid synthase-like methyltransferase
MEDNDARITIGFHYEDEYGNVYDSKSAVEVFHSLGETELDMLFEMFNTFLKQIGYVRRNDCLLKEDLTEEELWKVEEFVEELRNPSEPESEEGEDD